MHLTLTVSQRQELKQRIKISMGHKMEMKLLLIEGLRGETIKVKLDCGVEQAVFGVEGCGYKLTLEEVVKGFVRDPSDTTTLCPKCRKRFQPHVRVMYGSNATGEVIFMCANQCLKALEDRGDAYSRMLPADIRQKAPAMYFSLVFHYGNLKNAFAKIGFDYSAMETKDWEMKVRPFLGEAPDKLIAEVSGVTVSQVTKLRKSLKINQYQPKKGAEGDDDE